MTQCNLEVWSAFDGENSGWSGTIEVGGVLRQIECSGSASDRGTHATVDGKEEWWHGEGTEGTTEWAVEGVLDSVWDQVEKQGGTEGRWTAKVVDGQVVSVERQDEDEDD